MRILVVEDEKEIADGICLILEKAGYQADCAQDGLTGLDYIFSEIYDLVLLDIMLPKINGLDIIKNVRAQKIHTPIILLTAKSQIEDKVNGFTIGADDYITKPFDARELLARIGARLRPQTESADRRVTAFDISIDPVSYKLEKEEKSVKLSKTEYQLLEYLMINKTQILTKDQIICKIWGSDDETDYNNIEVYISFLRKKLKFVKADTQILTKKGVGYYLVERDKE